jgi:hypothetical protein
MQSERLGLVINLLLLCGLAGVPRGVLGESINVDEILLENNSSGDPSPDQLQPSVAMTLDTMAKRLTVTLSNEASYSGSPDAGHLLTGLAFNLPTGVVIQDTPTRDSRIWLPAGSIILDPKKDPTGASGIALTQDDWGYASGVASGHFVTEAVLDTNTVLSTMNSDAAFTFSGSPASNSLLDAVDYGLQGLAPAPGHSEKRSIRNAVGFELYLDGPATTDWDNLLSYIQDHAVVVSYGSPTGSTGSIVPEPASAMLCFSLGSMLLAFCWRRRQA